MLKKRILTAMLLLPIVLCALFLEPVWLWRAVVSVFIGVAWWEWVRLSKVGDKTGFLLLASGAFLGLMYIFSQMEYSTGLVSSAMIVWLIAMGVCFLSPPEMGKKVLPEIKLLFGAWVLSFTWWSLIWLREQENGPTIVLASLMIIWLADTGAYFAGKRFGKTKLAPHISPGKTIEGLAGGAICVAIYALVVSLFFMDAYINRSHIVLVIIAVIIAVVSVGGDLFESWLKRQANMKDSSQVLPGHGGVLDRIDSLIAAMPFILTAYAMLEKSV